MIKRKIAHFRNTRNKGPISAVRNSASETLPPLCHTYSEPSGHEDSEYVWQIIPHLCNTLSKSRLSDPFFGLFWVISEVGGPDYMAKSPIFLILSFFSNYYFDLYSLLLGSHIDDIYRVFFLILTGPPYK